MRRFRRASARGGATDRSARRARAQSSLVGYVLLTAIVAMTIGAVLVVGGAALVDVEDAAQVDRAETAMAKLDAEIAVVALDSERHRTVTFGGLDGYPTTVHDSGRMTVTMKDLTTGTTDTIADVDLGAIVYEKDGTTVAYQGGGVWRMDGSGARMVSPPEFHYRDATLTLPIIQVEGAPGGDPNEISIRKTDPMTQRYPDPAQSWTNPLVEKKVTVTVQSEYYRAWGDYFTTRTDGHVDYDHANDEVTLTLVSPMERPPLEEALYATAPGGTLKFAGTDARSDSYDSAAGDYATTSGNDGTIRVAGNVDTTGNVEIHGDIRTAGDFETGGSAYIDGDVYHAGTFSGSGSYTITGTTGPTDSFSGMDDVNALVSTRVNDAKDDNDNDATSDISGDTLTGGTMTLTAGTYYLTHLTLSGGETLYLDNSGGPVAIAVEDYVELRGDAKVVVTQPDGGISRIFVGGQDTTGGYHFLMDKQAGAAPQITVPDDRSTHLWIYGKDDMQGLIRGASGSEATLIGALFAPAGEGGSGQIHLKHADVYGGLVGANVEVGNKGGVHYDQALVYESPIPPDASIIPVSYLHVTTNRVEVGQGTPGGPANALPTALAAADSATVDEGNSVGLDGFGSSDADGSIDSYAWTITNGGGSLSNANTDNPTYDAPSAVASDQTVTIQLTVTDDGGATSTDAVQVTVRDTDGGNTVPIADAGSSTSVAEGNSVTLDGTGSSDGDGSVTGYAWSITSGSGSLADAETATPTYTAPADVSSDETTTLQLTVTDDDGATDTDTVDVTVLDGAGATSATVESFGVTDDTTGGNVQYTVNFRASGPGSIDVKITLTRAGGNLDDSFTRTYEGGSSGDVTTTLSGSNKHENYVIEIVVDDGTNQATDSVTDSPDGIDP